MSREIKFRAWMPKFGVMSYSYTLAEMLNDSLHHFDSDIWLQYTGLKDKNGVEIYEGDIIKGEKINWAESGEYGGMEGTVGIVTFEHARFILEDNESGARPDLAHGSAYHEVIGNIYENPKMEDGK